MRLRHACFLLRTRRFTLGKDVRALTPGQDPAPSVQTSCGGCARRLLRQAAIPERSIRPGHYQS
jgi:hypothetical protein